MAGCSPKMVLTRVLFPEPDGPTMAWIFPGVKYAVQFCEHGCREGFVPNGQRIDPNVSAVPAVVFASAGT